MKLTMVLDHLYLVFLSVLLTIAFGVPLGMLAYYFRPIQQISLWLVQLLQTVPAMALLGIVMVFLGAGKLTVIIGLLLYSLLPVVQNTCLGLGQVDPELKEVARGMGMSRFYRLIKVESPIAFPFIFTGIRIAVVSSVGVAVFATFVGGGGLGRAIYQGIRVQNMSLILQSTFMLMLMAVGFDLLLAFFEKKLYQRYSPASD